ncbi:hypothetical protein SH1V18_48400 [Vallitalea longa]|uniref:Uncharacterized protein n=1 Tax=Vallitalea longa TaxID=2936439 RepID=A0A9W5YH22_9FIRM|nr:hypothetical protein [Vallitalea longa]GKX32360.1 hypothetical protein SH1V18_48400 [Vallitalea longa]
MNKYIYNAKINENEKLSITLSSDTMKKLLHLLVQDLNDIIQGELTNKDKDFDIKFFQYVFYKYNELVIGLNRNNQEHFTFYVSEDYYLRYLIPFVNKSIEIVEGYNVKGYENFILELEGELKRLI